MKTALVIFVCFVLSAVAQDRMGDFLFIDRPVLDVTRKDGSVYINYNTSAGAVYTFMVYLEENVWPKGWQDAETFYCQRDGTMLKEVMAFNTPLIYSTTKSFSSGSGTPKSFPGLLTRVRVSPPDQHTILRTRNPLQDAKDRLGRSLSILEDLRNWEFVDLIENLDSFQPKYKSTQPECQQFKGTIQSSGCESLYIRTDDGAQVLIDGDLKYDTLGQNTSWDDVDSSFERVDSLKPGVNEVLVRYKNMEHHVGDTDGISLFWINDGLVTHSAISGPSHVYWCGNPYQQTWTYRVSASGFGIEWTASSNLTIVATNDKLQSIQVKPGSNSAMPLSDWVQARWYSTCANRYYTNRKALTIHRPRSLILRTGIDGLSERDGNTYFVKTNTFDVLDQFGTLWPSNCLATVTDSDYNGSPPSDVVLMDCPENMSLNFGKLPDEIGFKPPVGSCSFSRLRERRVHCKENEYGFSVQIQIVDYSSEPLGPTKILP